MDDRQTTTRDLTDAGQTGENGSDQRHNAETAHTDEQALLPGEQSEGVATRWQEIQTSFVDRPREAVSLHGVLLGGSRSR